MTTIAYSAKDRTMSADSKCTTDGVHTTKCQKIFSLPNGALLGSAGEADDRDVRELLGKSKTGKLPSRQALADTKTEFIGLYVEPNGNIYLIDIEPKEIGGSFEWTGSVIPIKERFAAIGSGEQLAIGAMANGASASMAVEIACVYDTCSGRPVHSVKLKTHPRKKAA